MLVGAQRIGDPSILLGENSMTGALSCISEGQVGRGLESSNRKLITSFPNLACGITFASR